MKPLIPAGSALRTVLDALPSYILITDDDIAILDCNEAAKALLDENGTLCLNERAGEAFQCIFARDAARGCGTSEFCSACELRGSVKRALAGETLRGQLAHMILAKPEGSVDFWFTVNASAITLDGRRVVLLALEDVTELVESREFLPLCPGCMEKRELGHLEALAQDFLRRHPGALLPQELCAICHPEQPLRVPGTGGALPS